MDKEHKTEINKMLARHQEELELVKIREPMLGTYIVTTNTKHIYYSKLIESQVILSNFHCATKGCSLMEGLYMPYVWDITYGTLIYHIC